jgi:hypothetical protein
VQDVLASLKAGTALPDADTEGKLRGVLTASFDSLSLAAQNMFLDAASVLHGFDKSAALRLWGGWWDGLTAAFQELARRHLVSVDDKGGLLVHDVIKSAGRGILRDPRSRFHGSRLWVLDDGQLLECSQVRYAVHTWVGGCEGALRLDTHKSIHKSCPCSAHATPSTTSELYERRFGAAAAGCAVAQGHVAQGHHANGPG